VRTASQRAILGGLRRSRVDVKLAVKKGEVQVAR
jgi:hypothetical protein